VEILDVILVDLVELGITMGAIVFIALQPVLRLLIGFQQPLCRNLLRLGRGYRGGKRRWYQQRRGKHG
jgi:hypothetical protein